MRISSHRNIMDYISVKEAADKWDINSRMVSYYCAAGRIEGAVKIGGVWVIPKDAPQPPDRSKKDGDDQE